MTMEILVRGSNVDVDPQLDTETRRKLAKVAKLAQDIRRVEVEFSEVRNPRVADALRCEVTVHLTRNLVKAHAAAPDARTALDRVMEKVGHQLDRVHDKRVHRSRPRHPSAPPTTAD
jgi:ribosomal subunit interface protein